MLAVSPRNSDGVNVNPKDHGLATSGLSWLFPSITWPHWPETHWGIKPYCALVTPVCAHAICDAVGVAPAQGSAPTTFSCPYEGATNNSIRLGARTARSKEKRKRASWIGAYCTSNL